MGKDKNKIKIDSVMDLNQVVSYLEDVVESLKKGSIHVQLGEDSLTVYPERVVDFEMTVSSKKDKEKFELEISWKRDKDAATDVTITTAEEN